MKKWFFLILVLTLCLASGNLFAGSESQNNSDAEILRKIKDIEATQNKILSTLDDIKTELHIIKIRASNNWPHHLFLNQNS